MSDDHRFSDSAFRIFWLSSNDYCERTRRVIEFSKVSAFRWTCQLYDDVFCLSNLKKKLTLKSLPVRGHFYLFQFRDLFVFECSHVLWYICTNCWLNMLVNTRECVLGILKTFLIPEVTYLQAVKNCCFESPKNDIWSSPVGTWAIQLLHMIHQSTGKINPFNYMCPTYCYDVMCDVSKTFSYIQDAFFFRFL